MRKLLPFLFAFVLPLTACKDSIGPSGIDGTYTLISINTQTLPVTVFASNAGRIDVTDATLVLRSDLTYTETLSRHLVPATGAAYSDVVVENGSYTVAGNVVTFTMLTPDGNPLFSYTGAVDGNTITYSFRGDSYTYRK